MNSECFLNFSTRSSSIRHLRQPLHHDPAAFSRVILGGKLCSSGNGTRSVRPGGKYRSIQHTKNSEIQTGVFGQMERAHCVVCVRASSKNCQEIRCKMCKGTKYVPFISTNGFYFSRDCDRKQREKSDVTQHRNKQRSRGFLDQWLTKKRAPLMSLLEQTFGLFSAHRS